MSAAALRKQGDFRFLSRDEDVLREVQQFFGGWTDPAGIHGEFRVFAGYETYFKAEPMAPWPRTRHAARRLFLGRPYPRLAEFENLEWMAARGFLVPRPLVAGVRKVWNGVAWQFLVTERLPEARPLVDGSNALHDNVLAALALEVARLHDFGFIHRDLHLRNLAWVGDLHDPQIVFFDAWRGGARLQMRGIAYDLACLMNGLAGVVGETCAEDFLERYLQARHPSRPWGGLRRSTGRQRARLLRRRLHRASR